MDQRAFVKLVRHWNAGAVAAALRHQPALATRVDRIGKTPMHHCAGINGREAGLPLHDSVGVAASLIDAGADVNAVRLIVDEGEEFPATPLWYSVAWGENFRLAKFLLQHGAKPNGCMWAACWAQNQEMAELLSSFGADVDSVFHGETPLLLIVKAKRFRLLRWLVKEGADINFQDPAGYSALHFAIKRNHNLQQIEELLSLGANPLLKARNGTTPMSLAIKLGKTKLVSMLRGKLKYELA